MPETAVRNAYGDIEETVSRDPDPKPNRGARKNRPSCRSDGSALERTFGLTDVVVSALPPELILAEIRVYKTVEDGETVSRATAFGLKPDELKLLRWCAKPRLVADIVAYLAFEQPCIGDDAAASGVEMPPISDALDTLELFSSKGLLTTTAGGPDLTDPDRLPLGITTLVVASDLPFQHLERERPHDPAALDLTPDKQLLWSWCREPRAVLELALQLAAHEDRPASPATPQAQFAHTLKRVCRLLSQLSDEGYITSMTDADERDLYDRRLYRTVISGLQSL
ncbi:hypothetical protein ACQEU6_07340 [Spirillospora sp. CA-108201]